MALGATSYSVDWTFRVTILRNLRERCPGLGWDAKLLTEGSKEVKYEACMASRLAAEMYACRCIYVYICVYTGVCACIYIYVCIYVYIHIYMCDMYILCKLQVQAWSCTVSPPQHRR